MNNIYKVIWSKAKNCYVVASEIAKSHTKSASGSEKIGGGTRRKLLASLMAVSLLCGGLGVASASLEVVDQSGTAGTVTIYTKDEVDNALTAKGSATDVAANKTDIETLKTAVGNAGSGLTKDVADQKADIATNRANINNLDGKLANLTTTVSGKADEAAVTTALGDKANTDLSNLTADGVNKIKNTMSADMDLKADKTYVDNALANKADTGTVTTLEGRVGGVEGRVTTLETKVGDASGGLVKDVADLKAQGNTLNTELGNKANQSDLDAAKNRITTNEGNITDLQKKTAKLSADGTELKGMTTVSGTNVEAGALKVTGAISDGAGVNTTLADIKASMTQTATNKGDIAALQTKTGEQQTAIDDLKKRTTKIDYDTATETTSVNGMKVGQQVDMGGKDITNARALTATGKVTGDGVDAGTGAITGGSLTVTGKVTGNGVDAGAGDITTTGNVKGGTLEATGNATIGGALTATGKVTGDGVDAGTGAITGGSLTVTGKVTGNGVDAGAGDITTSGNVKGGTLETTGNATIGGALTATGKVTGDGVDAGTGAITGGSLTVTGKVTGNGVDAGAGDITTTGNVKGGTLETTGDATIGGDLKVTGTITTDKMIFGDKATNNYTEIDKGHITSKNDALAGDATKKSSSMELDHSKLEVGVADKDSNGHLTMTADKTSIKNSDLAGKNYSEIVVDKDSVKTTVKDEEDNTTSTKSSATEIRNYAKDAAGNKTNNVQTATQNKSWAKDKDGNESSIVQTGKDITNTAQNGTITNDAQTIVNNATGDMTNTVGGNLTTTVTRQATEEFNGGLNTTVTGTENHTVNGKQINTVTEGQENIISGGQTNTITGDQTTTITGKKTETVTENVTEDYKKNLTTTVGGNEIHAVKGTKTETVEGKLTENFNGGQETYVTGDQTTNVSGTQTTTATDINRNASSGMIDTIDNDYGTNTETKVAGKTTTDVSIKGTGEKGKYIRGANESRDYLIKDTLMNSETKTAEATFSEITDGTNTASTRQDAKNLAGSVTNGTETGVSGIHAKDNSVSIDSIVTDGNKYSVINQKKGSIQSTVVDGTNSTVILQDKDNVTIASSNGTVGIVGKDIVNNAQDTITNTAGTKITDTAGDSTVTTENGKGTTFTKTGSTAYREGGPTDTNISGNTITTGKVKMDYAEVMKDLGVHGNAKVDQNLEVDGTSTLKGDVTMENNATVGKNLTVNGTTNLNDTNVAGKLDVTKEATFHDSVHIDKNLSVDGNANILGDVTAKSYKVGDKTYISADGINANNQKITNVADGSISEGSKDAVNGGQLYGVKRDLEHQVDKVGANAAAMANLHPMEFDPDSKWNIAAAMGNYGSETATAIGAFYRPNEDVMVNFSTAFGTGENMVGGGVSVRLGKGSNKLSREESNALKAQVNDLTARMDALLSVLNPNMSKDFPDVPENHWAYEAVSRLAGNDIVQGYPDGEFHGERTMTRYEMAEIIYNALSRGAEAEKELVEEFKPELQAMAASEKATAERAEG